MCRTLQHRALPCPRYPSRPLPCPLPRLAAGGCARLWSLLTTTSSRRMPGVVEHHPAGEPAASSPHIGLTEIQFPIAEPA